MTTTRTGAFPIGFRRGGSTWQKALDKVIAFARQEGFAALDLRKDGDAVARSVIDAGLRIGSVDLPEWHALASPDKAKREAAVDLNSAYIETCAGFGVRCFFVCIMAEDPSRPRSENFAYAVEGYGGLAPVLEKHGAWIVIEGWPGPSVLVTTPETYRAFLAECPARVAVNFDPSHLLRMGIDPIRFLDEFGPRVRHVHAKDTELLTEALYEFGHEVPPLRAVAHGYGNLCWRYTIPGHGQMRWSKAFTILAQAGYDGCVCVELEDENFHGSEADEKEGLVRSIQFLTGC